MPAPQPHGARYPWEKWFRRRLFTVRRGEDYRCTTLGMLENVRKAAARRRLVVRADVDGDGLTVRVIGRAEPKEGPCRTSF